MEELPSSQASERNKRPILDELKKVCTSGHLIEMGFGTAQHCTFMIEELPQITWYACDHVDNHAIFKSRVLVEKTSPRLKGPYLLWADQKSFVDQCRDQQMPLVYDYFYSANTLHIMTLKECEFFCRHVGEVLRAKGLLFLYGPFRFNNQELSQSNQEFHRSLVSRGVGSGIKDYDWITSLLYENGVISFDIKNLPSHNSLLIFQKQ